MRNKKNFIFFFIIFFVLFITIPETASAKIDCSVDSPGCYCLEGQKNNRKYTKKNLSKKKCRSAKAVSCTWDKPENISPQCVKKDDSQDKQKGESNNKQGVTIEEVKKEASELNKIKGASATNTTKSFSVAVGNVVQILLNVLGTLALAMFIYGGLLIMTSEGKSDRYLKGMKILLWTSLGTVVILSSYALTNFVFRAF
ncbi:MAG: hypothetical protein ABEJ02_00725 [Candidatus Paceibacteria bacterium]